MTATSINPEQYQVCGARGCLLVYAGCLGDAARPSWMSHVEEGVLGIRVRFPDAIEHSFYYAARVAGKTDQVIRWEFLPCLESSFTVRDSTGREVIISKVIVVAGTRGGSA